MSKLKVCKVFIFLGIVNVIYAQEKASGFVFNDYNKNGIKEVDEPGMMGVSVTNGVEVIETDQNGEYILPLSDDCIMAVIKPSDYELPPGYAYGDTIYLNWEQDITPDNVAVKNWPFSRKVQGTDPNDVSTSSQYNDQICLRLANTYLLKAEAEYLLDKPGDAATTINVLRRRAHASEITAADLSIDFILDERSRELVLEEDRRWTLLRTDKWLERTKAHNKNGGQFVSKRDLLYPIPQVVIDANITKEMQQNPGFE